MNNSALQPLEPQRVPPVPYSMVDVLRLVHGFPSLTSLSVLQTDVLFRGRGSCCAPGLATHGPALQDWGSHCHPVSASYLSLSLGPGRAPSISEQRFVRPRCSSGGTAPWVSGDAVSSGPSVPSWNSSLRHFRFELL